jgi:hypothetical protein
MVRKMASHDLLLLGAGLAASATCLAHVFLGGKFFARPLLASSLRSPVKYTTCYCWHLATAALALMAGAFFWAALVPEARPAALAATALAGAFLIVSVAQNPAMRLSFARHPQGVFSLIMSALGAASLFHA